MLDTIREKKYIYIKDFFTKEELAILQPYCLERTFNAKDLNDRQSPGCPCFYGDPIFDIILEAKRKKAMEVANLNLLKTYAYWRGYVHGGILPDHTDRPSCEISITANVDSCGEKWPIHMDNEWMTMEVGDAVMYLGYDILHGRKPFEGKYCAQVFFHYVDAYGPFKSFENDGRKK